MAETTQQVFEFSDAEKAEIKKHVAKYPEKRSAVMPTLWIAQEKFGWLSPEAIQLVADELGLSFAHVHGVASFYTMYFKRKVPKYLFDICTCFTCGECGGDEMYEHARKALKVDDHGFSSDGLFWVRQAECLAACDTAPVMQVANRRLVHKLSPESFDKAVEMLRKDKMPDFVEVPPIHAAPAGNGAEAPAPPAPEPPVAEASPEVKSEEE